MEQAAIGALVVGVVLVVAAVAAFLWARRAVRRRLRVWRETGASAGVEQVRSLARQLDTGALFRLEPLDPTWRAARRDRIHMQRAVRAAGAALQRAEDAGAIVGDLPSVLRRTEAAAEQVSVLLEMGSREDHHVEASSQADAVVRAADAIRRAAMTSVAEQSGPAARRAASDADREARAVLAGIDRSRA